MQNASVHATPSYDMRVLQGKQLAREPCESRSDPNEMQNKSIITEKQDRNAFHRFLPGSSAIFSSRCWRRLCGLSWEAFTARVYVDGEGGRRSECNDGGGGEAMMPHALLEVWDGMAQPCSLLHHIVWVFFPFYTWRSTVRPLSSKAEILCVYFLSLLPAERLVLVSILPSASSLLLSLFTKNLCFWADGIRCTLLRALQEFNRTEQEMTFT